MENNLPVFNCIRKDIDYKLNEQLPSILQTTCSTDEIIKKLDVPKLEEEVCEKYIQPVASAEIKFTLENEELWTSLNVSDYDDYDRISQNLNKHRNTSTQLRSLDKLLSAYIIDTKQKSWLPLSKNLQQCLLSSNDNLFRKSMRIHFKIISTPTTSSEGYLNLIQGMILMFNGELFKNSNIINENNRIHRRVVYILKLILQTQKVLLKNWLHIKQKIIEEVLITFIYMLNSFLGSERELGVLDFLSMLDSEAKWFKQYCYGVQTRNIILSCLKRTPNLTKHFISTFLNYLDDSSEHSRNHRQFLNFSQSAHFLSQFLIYQQTVSIFPVKVRSFQDSLTLEHFMLIIISKVNTWSDSPRRNILVKLLKCLLVNHSNLFLNLEIKKYIFEPFNLKNIDKKQLYLTVERNYHILDIMNNIANSRPCRLILHNQSDLKKSGRRYKHVSSANALINGNFSTSALTSRERNNTPLQIIVNITIACIRYFVNKSESQQNVNNVIFKLIDSCHILFYSQARSFALVNPHKLIISLRDLYKTVMNHENNHMYYKSRIAASLRCFIESDITALKTLESESKFLHEIVSNVLINWESLCGESNSCTKFILSIANANEGSDIVMYNHDLLLKQILMEIWYAENNEMDFMLSANVEFERKSNELYHFVHIISYNYKAVKGLLCFENEDTIVEHQERPLVLAELIENCLDSTCLGTTDTLVGLKILKILIANVDVLLYLQNNYRLQENLIELQVNSRMPCSSYATGMSSNDSTGTAILIDDCSSLRHNILLYIKYIGHIDEQLNEKLVEQSNLVVAPYKSSSALRRHQKTQSDFQKFLRDSKNALHDNNWLLQAKRVFKASCKEIYKTSTLLDLVDQIPKTTTLGNYNWPSTNTVLFGLFAEDYHGVTIVVRFGVQNGILQSSLQNEDNLMLLLKQSRTYLSYRPEEFMGFDWFVAVIFLICSGNLEKCKTVLQNIINMAVATIIWPMFAMVSNANKNVCNQFYRQLEIILEDSTRIGCALQILGTSARHIAQKWLNHCFFSILDFSEIYNFVTMAVLYPPEYIIFFVLAIFEHKKEDIFAATHESNLLTNLKVMKVLNFHITDYFNFMDKLFKQYKNVLQI